jgi:hypothetical protein
MRLPILSQTTAFFREILPTGKLRKAYAFAATPVRIDIAKSLFHHPVIVPESLRGNKHGTGKRELCGAVQHGCDNCGKRKDARRATGL